MNRWMVWGLLSFALAQAQTNLGGDWTLIHAEDPITSRATDHVVLDGRYITGQTATPRLDIACEQGQFKYVLFDPQTVVEKSWGRTSLIAGSPEMDVTLRINNKVYRNRAWIIYSDWRHLRADPKTLREVLNAKLLRIQFTTFLQNVPVAEFDTAGLDMGRFNVLCRGLLR